MTIEFKAWPKIPRLFRDVVITEKIDGTNAAIHIEPYTGYNGDDFYSTLVYGFNNTPYLVAAQSRNRLITPNDDNYNFARYVYDHADDLVELLGPGIHYGEWYGSGIQRNYGLQEKRFALFNTHRWNGLRYSQLARDLGVDVVPVLYQGPFDTNMVDYALSDLRAFGSKLVPGFLNPEGVIIYHTASKQSFKVLLENDDKPKGN